ncbi:hypothetical protein G7Y89_g11701 [Cudoniella acicularis]|uniref:SET domain-containing protein n=1 Tax=Cudoniella acicularis TaxID=354080 RepID=A0A8H4VXM2_9HELO|nr:hypothetical protein G7Y89_g11701 [Cudoniella acicularis]
MLTEDVFTLRERGQYTIYDLFKRTLVLLLLSIFGLIGFIIYSVYISTEPLIRRTLFNTPTAIVAYIGTLVQGLIVWSLLYYMPLYFQVAKNYSPITSAIAIFPFTFTVAPAAVVVASASNADLPFAGAIYSFFRAFGQTLGVAISGVIFQNVLKKKILATAYSTFIDKWSRDAKETELALACPREPKSATKLRELCSKFGSSLSGTIRIRLENRSIPVGYGFKRGLIELPDPISITEADTDAVTREREAALVELPTATEARECELGELASTYKSIHSGDETINLVKFKERRRERLGLALYKRRSKLQVKRTRDLYDTTYTSPIPESGQRKSAATDRSILLVYASATISSDYDVIPSRRGKESVYYELALIISTAKPSNLITQPSNFKETEGAPTIQLVQAISALEKRSLLTEFLDRFAKVKLVEIIDKGKEGRTRVDLEAIINLINGLRWQNSKTNQDLVTFIKEFLIIEKAEFKVPPSDKLYDLYDLYEIDKKCQILEQLAGEFAPLNTYNDGWPIEFRRPDIADEPVAQIYLKETGNWVKKVNHSCNPSAEFRVIKISR